MPSLGAGRAPWHPDDMHLRGVACAVVVLVVGLLALPGTTTASASTLVVGPGMQMVTQGRVCTANFVFRDRAGRTFVGYAAHCASPGADALTDGCRATSWPNGTRVRFARGVNSAFAGTTVGYGRLYWSSWRAMRRTGVQDAARCLHNDFALVQVEAAYLSRVDPTMPFWGGPTGLAGPPAQGGRVYTYGSSAARGSSRSILSPKAGHVTDRYFWGATVFTPAVGIPNDTGSGLLDNLGRASATLSVPNASRPGGNRTGALAAEVRFANWHGLRGLHLVRGREPFTRSAVF